MEKFKEKFYLGVARYFALWARIALAMWRPEVVVVTGSSGKTSVFYMLAAQIGEKAVFAHNSNSAYGIPFNILGIERHSYSMTEWIWLFVKAPFCILAWRGRPKLYIVEADAERPGEATFIQKLLKPKTVAITNVYQTHAKFFDELVASGKYEAALPAIADEFVKFLTGATRKAIINADSQPLFDAVERANLSDDARKNMIYLQAADYLFEYKLSTDRTQFVIEGQEFSFPYFLPRDVAIGIEITKLICDEFNIRMQRNFDNYYLPPGRSSIFNGVKNTRLIDSTYNANLGSMEAILDAYEQYPAEKKWAVLGEFRDQGKESVNQHRQLAEYIWKNAKSVEKWILVSPEMKEWVYPTLVRIYGEQKVKAFETAGEAYVWLWENIQGGETILLKGSQGRHLEGIVEGLLADPADAEKLSCRKAVFRAAQEEILSQVNKG